MPPERPPRLGPGVRKAALAAVVVAGAYALSALRAGPLGEASPGAGDDTEHVRANIALALSARRGHPVAAEDVFVVEAPENAEAPAAIGRAVVVWYRARVDDAEGAAADIFRVPMRLGRTGVPVSVGAATNLSRTPHGDERLLAWSAERVVWGLALEDHITSLTYLDLGVDTTPSDVGFVQRALGRVAARQTWGLPRTPVRHDVRLVEPARGLTARLVESGVELQDDAGRACSLSAADGTLAPAGWGRVYSGASDKGELLSMLADALRSSALVGTARVVALEASLFQVRDWLERARHALFPTPADREPVGVSVDLPAARLEQWPPPPLSPPGVEPFEGEGLWTTPVPDRPNILRTFLRVDARRPYERVYLFAFDMRALALRFVAGTRDPRSTTGVQGSGRIAPSDRGAAVAAFNGGFKLEHGEFGTVEAGGAVVPPSPGWATVALDADGRARMGVWDVEGPLPEGVVALRQNLTPLIADGVVNPARSRQWGQLVARLDAEHTPRSALGVSTGGILVFAWSLAASADQIGEAMRRAGVLFAMHLDMNPGHTGLSFLAPAATGGELGALGPGAPEMDHREGRWLGPETRDFFYLVERARLASGRAEAAAGEVTPPKRPAAEPEDLGVARASDDEPAVRVWRFAALTAAVVPGVADAVQLAEPTRAVRLPAAPRAWLEVGLRARDAGFGLVAGGVTLSPPRDGAWTWWVGADGAPALTRWRADAQRAPRDLIQGPPLVEGGRLAEALDTRVVATPIAPGEAAAESLVGLGLDAEGRVLVGVGPVGYVAALGRALVDRGAVNALLTSQRSTPETGSLRQFDVVDGRLVERSGDAVVVRPEAAAKEGDAEIAPDLRPRLGTALAFFARPAEVYARAVETFAEGATGAVAAPESK